MRIIATLSVIFFALSNLAAQNTNVAFRSKVTYAGQKLANVWGYAAGGYEYALVGALNGMSIVDVTNPDNPVVITQIPGPSSSWREIKTYQNYAYVVTEGIGTGQGLQVVNLSNLPNSNVTWTTYTGNNAIAGQLSRVHALQVDEVKGYLYLFGSQLYGGRALIFNLNPNPAVPNYVGYVNHIGYVHDGYANNDTLYAGHIYAGLFAMYDMTNKTAPVLLATQSTPLLFTHNTWRSGNTLFTTDEKANSTLAAYDISNPGNITLLDQIQSNPGTSSTVHNTYLLNSYAITSWYRDGFTIVDAARPSNLVQVGNYDTYSGGGAGFDGAWGVYPYLPSGNILVSNITGSGSSNGELFVLTPTYVRGCYVEGAVTNAQTGQPINGAVAQLVNTSTQTTSLANGQYKMGQLGAGFVTLRVSKSGFTTFETPVVLINGQLTLVNVALSPASLPVELAQFEAYAEGSDAVLTWTTASETQNSGFDVQRAPEDAGSWTSVAFVPGAGNSAAPNDYRLRVPGLDAGAHLFRLRQLDADGTPTLSPIRRVEIAGPPRPRPVVQPNVMRRGDPSPVVVYLPGSEPARIEVFDAGGQTVFRRGVESERTVDLPARQWPPGLYVVTVQIGREPTTLRLVVE